MRLSPPDQNIGWQPSLALDYWMPGSMPDRFGQSCLLPNKSCEQEGTTASIFGSWSITATNPKVWWHQPDLYRVAWFVNHSYNALVINRNHRDRLHERRFRWGSRATFLFSPAMPRSPANHVTCVRHLARSCLCAHACVCVHVWIDLCCCVYSLPACDPSPVWVPLFFPKSLSISSANLSGPPVSHFKHFCFQIHQASTAPATEGYWGQHAAVSPLYIGQSTRKLKKN